MRFELIGYGPLPDDIHGDHEQDNSCLQDRGVPLWVENRDVPDESLAASTYGQSNHAPWLARLNLDTAYGWIPTLEDANPFLEVDLQTKHLVTGVITQGHRDLQWWTTSTWLEFFDGQFWKYIYEDDCGSRTLIPFAIQTRAKTVGLVHPKQERLHVAVRKDIQEIDVKETGRIYAESLVKLP
nr:lactadherin-like [Lytechinus pictus]